VREVVAPVRPCEPEVPAASSAFTAGTPFELLPSVGTWLALPPALVVPTSINECLVAAPRATEASHSMEDIVSAVHDNNFAGVAQILELSPSLVPAIRQVFLLVLTSLDINIADAENELVQHGVIIENSDADLEALRLRASRCIDQGRSRAAASEVLRDIEALSAERLRERDRNLELRKEKLRALCTLRLRRTLLEQMESPLLNGDVSKVRILQERLPSLE